ncbi:TPA: hypothetical protein ACH3X1_003364 [Trebouxia sp. C0004]
MTQRSYLRHECMQDDDAAWGQNPFDFTTDGVTDGTSAEGQALADIDARIQEYRDEHIWDEEGYMRSLRSPQMPPRHNRCPSASSSEAPLLTTTNSFCESIIGSISLIEARVKDDETDYLAAKRQAKHLASALHAIDATLRELRTSSLPSVPTKAELAFLLEPCQK